MSKLIIHSRQELQVGQVYRGITDPWSQHLKNQPIKIIAGATEDEWIECMVAHGIDRGWAELLSSRDPYFYEFQID